ncbi:MAG: hypothetical protein RIT27_1263 [Pseudomonadota bacterium]|jgi:anhydro-N-acetylmuramic acid kinase
MLFIGLMSGTSIDAIDAVLVDFSEDFPRLIATHQHYWSPSVRQQLLQISQTNQAIFPATLAHLDQVVADTFADAVDALLKQTNYKHSDIQALGSHGQTLWHQPPRCSGINTRPFTWQIGDPNIIAQRTEITTVSDFRRRDLAAGGQGAPLVPAFHAALFRHSNEVQIVLNIGGIANITVLPPAHSNAPIIGFDTGTGNALLDAWALQHLGVAMDLNGEWAAQGKTNPLLLENLLQDAYFSLPPPKSTGRDYFNLHWLQPFLKNETPQDVQMTLVDLTVESVARAIAPFQATTVLVCGGGVHNALMMRRLNEVLQIPVISTAALNVDPDWIEASCFAWLAKQTLEKKTGNLPSVTGAKQAVILGGIYYA